MLSWRTTSPSALEHSPTQRASSFQVGCDRATPPTLGRDGIRARSPAAASRLQLPATPTSQTQDATEVSNQPVSDALTVQSASPSPDALSSADPLGRAFSLEHLSVADVM